MHVTSPLHTVHQITWPRLSALCSPDHVTSTVRAVFTRSRDLASPHCVHQITWPRLSALCSPDHVTFPVRAVYQITWPRLSALCSPENALSYLACGKTTKHNNELNVLSGVLLRIEILLDVLLCGWVSGYRRFGGL
jgi:hypothetical protein